MNNQKIINVLNIRIPNQVKQQFKKATSGQGETMTDAIKDFINDYITTAS